MVPGVRRRGRVVAGQGQESADATGAGARAGEVAAPGVGEAGGVGAIAFLDDQPSVVEVARGGVGGPGRAVPLGPHAHPAQAVILEAGFPGVGDENLDESVLGVPGEGAAPVGDQVAVGVVGEGRAARIPGREGVGVGAPCGVGGDGNEGAGGRDVGSGEGAVGVDRGGGTIDADDRGGTARRTGDGEVPGGGVGGELVAAIDGEGDDERVVGAPDVIARDQPGGRSRNLGI